MNAIAEAFDRTHSDDLAPSDGEQLEKSLEPASILMLIGFAIVLIALALNARTAGVLLGATKAFGESALLGVRWTGELETRSPTVTGALTLMTLLSLGRRPPQRPG